MAREVWLDDALGNRLALIDDMIDYELVRTYGKVGAFTVRLPQTFDFSLLHKDYLLEFWHGYDPGALRCIGVGKIRKRTISENDKGVSTILAAGPDFNDTLKTRIVAYAAGSAYTDKTDYADDLLKAVMRENFGSSATDTARNLSAYNLRIEADASLGPSITKAFSRKNVFDVLNDVCNVSAEQGTPLYYDLVPEFLASGALGFVFQTWINQPGKDRTASSNQPALFGSTWGNLYTPQLQYDDTNEITYIYCGGQGQEDQREIVTASDTARMGDSPWNRREGFADARNEKTTAALTDKARSELYDKRGKLKFSGKLLDTPSSRYGIDWQFGDRVTAEYMGLQFDGLVQSIKYTVDSDGDDAFEVKLEVEQ